MPRRPLWPHRPNRYQLRRATVMTFGAALVGASLFPAPAQAATLTRDAASQHAALIAPAASYSYSTNVWTTGGQSAIDACRGAVRVPFSNGYTVVAEHNYCGGSWILKVKQGQIIRLTGAASGLFKAVAFKNVPQGSSSQTLVGMGPAKLVLQTCYFNSNQMRLVGLQRISSSPGPAKKAAATCAGYRATIVGTSRSEVIRGTSKRDVIVGGGGNDRIYGGGGNDIICGGSGNDRIWGGSGKDRIYGGTGADYLRGGSGADYIRGDSGKDRIYGDSGNDTLKGGSGFDKLWGGTGRNKFYR